MDPTTLDDSTDPVKTGDSTDPTQMHINMDQSLLVCRNMDTRTAIKAANEPFSKEENLKLIRAYEAHPVLWDLFDRYHYSRVRRMDAWQEVSRIAGKPVDACRYKMSRQTCKFRAEKEKMMKFKTNNKAKQFVSKWYWFEPMSFMMTNDAHKLGELGENINITQPVNKYIRRKRKTEQHDEIQMGDDEVKTEVEETLWESQAGCSSTGDITSTSKDASDKGNVDELGENMKVTQPVNKYIIRRKRKTAQPDEIQMGDDEIKTEVEETFWESQAGCSSTGDITSSSKDAYDKGTVDELGENMKVTQPVKKYVRRKRKTEQPDECEMGDDEIKTEVEETFWESQAGCSSFGDITSSSKDAYDKGNVDEITAFTSFVMAKMLKYSAETRSIVQKQIEDILFHADQNHFEGH